MYLFFVRRYNDVDHMSPIIYRMVKDGIKNLAVLVMNPKIDIEDDFRLRFLVKEFNVSIEYVYKFHSPRWHQKIAGWYICWSEKVLLQQKLLRDKIAKDKTPPLLTTYFATVQRLLLKIWQHFFHASVLQASYAQFNLPWARSLLEENETSLVIFDFQPKNYVTEEIMQAVKELDIPIIGVPHGVNLVVNQYSTTTSVKNKNTESDRWKQLDAVAVQFEIIKKKAIKNGLPESKLRVLGSTRFCEEWEKIYFPLIPQTGVYQKAQDASKIRVVYMDNPGADYRFKVDQVEDTIRRIAKLDFVDLVIKPSTGRQEERRRGISSNKLFDFAPLDYETHSLELIRWADVVFGVLSSILLEALILNKTFLYPKYFHKNITLWETRGACWQVNDFEEMEAALKKISKNRTYKPYSEETISNFIQEVVYGGVKNRDVLGDYKDFVISSARNHPEQASSSTKQRSHSMEH